MRDMKFHIFGVPNGFNLYQGNAEDDKYFQLFYDGSKEDSKLTINRKENGDISYNYLRYNLVSGGNRTGAFLGISIVFNRKYCYDVVNLYNLFDFIFDEIIVKDAIILDKVNNSYKFKITRFDDVQSEEIEKTFQSLSINISDETAGFDIRPVDNSFTNAKNGLVCKLAFDAGNEKFLSALMKYSWLTISKSYKTATAAPEVELSLEQLQKYDDSVKKLKDGIIQCYSTMRTDPAQTDKKVTSMNTQVQNALKAINSYIKKQPHLAGLQSEYRTLSSQLIELRSTLASMPAPSNKPKQPNSNKQRKPSKPKKKNKMIYIICTLVAVCIALGLLFLGGSNKKGAGEVKKTDPASEAQTGINDQSSQVKERGEDSKPEQENKFNEPSNLSDMVRSQGGSDNNDNADDTDEMYDRDYRGVGTIRLSSNSIKVGTPCTVAWTGEPIGEWRCDGGIINNRLDSKTTIKFSKPGSYDLYYVIDDQPVGSVKISVGSQSHGSTPKSQTKAQTKMGTQKPPVTSKSNQQGTQQQGGKTYSSGSGNKVNNAQSPQNKPSNNTDQPRKRNIF